MIDLLIPVDAAVHVVNTWVHYGLPIRLNNGYAAVAATDNDVTIDDVPRNVGHWRSGVQT